MDRLEYQSWRLDLNLEAARSRASWPCFLGPLDRIIVPWDTALMERLISALGLITMIGIAWLMSSHKRRVSGRIVIGGLILQFVFAFIILKTQPGRWLFQSFDYLFTQLLAFVDNGSAFLFGESFRDHYFAFKVLPTIIFFSAFMSIFYYYGIMQKIVGVMAGLMQKSLGTSGAETLASAANIFVGQTEAPLVIRPYIKSMTLSELNAVMVGGFATIAGGVLAAFVEMGISATHLLSASVISAPAALLIAKVMQPEVDEPQTLGRVKITIDEPASNVLEAVANGTTGGLKLALNVGAMLLTFLALLAMLDAWLGWCGELVEWTLWGGNDTDAVFAGRDSLNWLLGHRAIDDAGFGGFFSTERNDLHWSMTGLLGLLFAPMAWLMGVEWNDCYHAGKLLGLKMASNEFIAYGKLAEWTETGSPVQLAERTQVIMTYALCGFANFSSIGIQLGGIGGIAPERSKDLARLGFRAMLGGTLAAFMTACVAGMLLEFN